MSDEPTLVKILKYLHDKEEPSNYGNIITAVQKEQELIDKALFELAAQGIIDIRDGRYSFSATPSAEEFSQKLFALYEKVLREPQMNLIICGLLSRAGGGHMLRKDTLLHVLAMEGFAADDVLRMLETEMERRYIQDLQIDFIGMVLSSPPVLVPACYGPRLRVNAAVYDLVKGWCKESGSSSITEEYLTSSYPEELAQAGIQYVETEKQRAVTAVLREEASHQEAGIDLVPWHDAFQSTQSRLGISEVTKGALESGAYAFKRLTKANMIGVMKLEA